MYTHRQLCVLAARWLLEQPSIQLVNWEFAIDKGIVDVLGMTTRTKKYKTPKVVVIEVKRTRGDLLSDLKRQKMLKYEKKATHCYLAATPEAYLTSTECKNYTSGACDTQILQSLKTLGLPDHWGVLILENHTFRCIRGSRGTQSKLTSFTLEAILKKIAISSMYRMLNNEIH